MALELASELVFDPQGSVDWGRNWLDGFDDGITQIVSFDQSNNSGDIDVKKDGSVLEENYVLRCLGWISLLNLIGALIPSLMLEVPPRKLEPWFALWSLSWGCSLHTDLHQILFGLMLLPATSV